MDSHEDHGNPLTLAAPPLVPQVDTLRLPPVDALLPPPSIPGYVILEMLGRGGMGIVYKARHEALQRVVALKMILHGAQAAPAEAVRFRNEAEAVARLQHPHIVQIYEVGEHHGQPYLSLEYVAGGPLSKRLDGKPQLALPAAALVETLARTIHVAHQNGVVHRDLKPANVLIGDRPDREGQVFADRPPADSRWPEAVKITDFGLAKRLDATSDTRTGDILGTPSYMSPEQASGHKTVGPSTDIHALGAILYELLTGRPPFLGATSLETLLQVTSADPVPPSWLNPKTPRDLDTICMHCLEKDPRRRYATALELADDLRRFQHHEPIHARPASRVERLSKWARRRPAICALLLTAFLAVMALLAGGWWHELRLVEERDEADAQRQAAQEQRDRAEKHFAKALEAVDQMLLRVGHRSLDGSPNLEQVRRDLLLDALKFYKRFLDEGQRPELRWKTARAYRLLGDIERSLVNQQEAIKASTRAVELLNALLAESAGRAEYREELAAAQTNLALVHLARGELTQAQSQARLALEGRQQLATDFPAQPAHRVQLAAAHLQQGRVLFAMRQHDNASKAYQTALKEYAEAATVGATDADQRAGLALTHYHVGELAAATADLHGAETAFRDALKGQEPLAQEFPKQPDYSQAWARTLHDLAQTVQRAGRSNEALKLFSQALEIRGRLATRFSSRPDLREELAENFHTFAIFLRESKLAKSSESAFAEAIKIQEGVVELSPGAAKPRYRLALLYDSQAVRMAESGGEAEKWFAMAAKHWQQLTKDAPKSPEYPHYYAMSLNEWASYQLKRGEKERARESLEEALRQLDSVRRIEPSYGAADDLAERVRKRLASL